MSGAERVLKKGDWYLMTPLWPAIGEALARGDFAWARRVTRRAIVLSLSLGFACVSVLLVLSRPFMRHWAGVDVGAVDWLRLGFAAWVILVGYVATMNAILNQPGVMRRHLVWFGTASLASLALKIACGRHGSLAGVVWSTVICFGVLYVGPATRLAFRSVDGEATA